MNDDYVSPPIEIVTRLTPVQWQPMSTAPKNGTRILSRCLDGDRGKRSAHRSVSIGRWDRHEVYGVPAPDWYSDDGYYLEPDGWMPLPGVD